MEEQKEEQRIQCNRCKVKLLPSNFSEKRDGVLLKSCDKCRETRNKNKCEHGRKRSSCKECGGSQICEHNRRRGECKDCGGSQICEHGRIRSQCKDCGGSQICEHGRQRSSCKECGGSQVCEHGRIRSSCKECGGVSICEHGRRRNRCKDCGGASICEHGRQRSSCKECGGSQVCEHGRIRSQCKECSDPIKVTIKHWISQSRQSDKKKDRYDADHFIDKCFLKGLVEEYPNCYYCTIPLQYIEYQDDLVTIERIDNSLGHIKSNCVLACRKCNLSRVGDSR